MEKRNRVGPHQIVHQYHSETWKVCTHAIKTLMQDSYWYGRASVKTLHQSLVVDEDRMRPGHYEGQCFVFPSCFDTVGWVTEGHAALKTN